MVASKTPREKWEEKSYQFIVLSEKSVSNFRVVAQLAAPALSDKQITGDHGDALFQNATNATGPLLAFLAHRIM